jgi:hypothetical protein
MRNTDKQSEIVAASASRTATGNFSFISNTLGGAIIINVTGASVTPSVVFTVKGQDPASGATWDILASAAITGIGTTVLRIHPELTGSANTIAKDFLPKAVVITATHADADPITYSIGFAGVN